MKRVYIIEDEVLLRDLVVDLIGHTLELEIVGSNLNGLEGCRACEKMKPDLVILDVNLPGMNGIEITRRLREARPDISVLVFSGNFELATLRRVLLTKPNGIIEKAAGLAEMQKAISAVASGQTYYSPAIVQRMPELLMHGDSTGDPLDELSPREREVLQLIGEGFTTKEIAGKLFISARTADVHRTNIMRKLDVHNVAGLTRTAIACGLVSV